MKMELICTELGGDPAKVVLSSEDGDEEIVIVSSEAVDYFKHHFGDSVTVTFEPKER